MIGECSKFQQELKDWLAGELDQESVTILKRHLEDCPACQTEHELLQGTLKTLVSLEAEDVPRHFYVYRDDRRSFRSWVRTLTWPWRIAWIGAAAVFLLISLLVASNAHLQLGSDGVIFAIGTPIPRPVDVEALRSDLLAAVHMEVEEGGQRLHEQITEEWRLELSATRADLRTETAAQLVAYEGQAKGLAEGQARQVQTKLEGRMSEIYRTLAIQHRQDLNDLQLRLDRQAVAGQLRANQTDSVVTALLQMASYRNP